MGRAIRINKTLILLASLAGLGACGDKNVTNLVVVAVPTTLTMTTINGQTGVAGAALPAPIGVRVLDQNGVALAGAVVGWEVLTGGGSVSSPTSTSDVTGEATIVWTLGATAGDNSARAFLSNGQSVTFTATGIAGAFTSFAMVSGDLQTVTAGTATQPLVIRAVDANGNAVAGVTVTWTTTGGGTLDQTTTTTDASGLTQVVLTTNLVPVAYTVTASSGAATPIVFTGSGT